MWRYVQCVCVPYGFQLPAAQRSTCIGLIQSKEETKKERRQARVEEAKC